MPSSIHLMAFAAVLGIGLFVYNYFTENQEEEEQQSYSGSGGGPRGPPRPPPQRKPMDVKPTPKPVKYDTHPNTLRNRHVEIEKCIICQDALKSFGATRKLSCNHSFHSKCLEQWIVQKSVCPICFRPCSR